MRRHLAFYDRRIDLVFLTHPQADHLGGHPLRHIPLRPLARAPYTEHKACSLTDGLCPSAAIAPAERTPLMLLPSSNRSPSPERTGRGGPRPGSGPPRGNLNALKHGRTSRQYQRLLHLVAGDPEARDILLRVARVQRRRRDQAQGDANRLLIAVAAQLRERAIDAAVARYENDQRIPPLPDTDPPPNGTFS